MCRKGRVGVSGCTVQELEFQEWANKSGGGGRKEELITDQNRAAAWLKTPACSATVRHKQPWEPVVLDLLRSSRSPLSHLTWFLVEPRLVAGPIRSSLSANGRQTCARNHRGRSVSRQTAKTDQQSGFRIRLTAGTNCVWERRENTSGGKKPEPSFSDQSSVT